MLNVSDKKRSGVSFNASECDKCTAKNLSLIVPHLKSEELLEIRHITQKRAIVNVVTQELFNRLEAGDCVEVIEGLEKIVRKTKERVFVEGRDHAYTKNQISFYMLSRHHDGKCIYFLKGIEW